ncbi:hypothetical protein JCM10207_008451 [Rhodosporidiobolus poonsookiae]
MRSFALFFAFALAFLPSLVHARWDWNSTSSNATGFNRTSRRTKPFGKHMRHSNWTHAFWHHDHHHGNGTRHSTHTASTGSAAVKTTLPTTRAPVKSSSTSAVLSTVTRDLKTNFAVSLSAQLSTITLARTHSTRSSSTRRASSTSRASSSSAEQTTSSRSRASTTKATSSSSAATTASSTTKKTSTSAAATATASSGSKGLTSEQAQIALDTHNALRMTHQVSNMTWDEELAEQAQEWVDKCVFTHGGTTNAGQNLAAGSGSDPAIAGLISM